MNKEELINRICELSDKRHSGEFHIKAEVARHMISLDIDGYMNTFKEQILEIIFKHTKNRKEFKLWEQKIINLCNTSYQNSDANKTHPYIWGGGWYAIPDRDGENAWCLAPIKFFDENGHCPDGWEWETPEGLSNEELNEFIDEHGCEPEIPKEFSYCMESTIECVKEIPMEKQKQILKDFGYVVDNIPKWKYDRKR